jgi:photosystem II stability/assembly factor-like uncharacterized protein
VRKKGKHNMYHRSALRSALIISLLSLFISQIGIVSAGNNFWTGIGPEGGQIYILAVAPSLPGGDPNTPATLYAGTDGGVFKSTNGGENWSAANTGMVSAAVTSLIIDPLTPTTLYARTKDNVFKSTNSGENWSAIGVAGHNVQVLAVAPPLPGVDPLTPTTLYAGTGGGGIFKSTDGGLNWSEISLLSGKDYIILVIDPQTPTTLYIKAKNSGMFKSTNGGANWNAIGTGQIEYVKYLLIAPRLPGIDPATPATLYAAASGGVFKSTDGGENWSTVNEGLTNTYVQTLAMDPAVPTTLYAATPGGLFKSINSGANWNGINSDQTEISTLVIDPLAPTTLYAGTTYDGVFKSTNGGENWSVVNTGLTATFIKTLVIDPKTPTTLYVATQDGLFKSTNSGGNWSALTGLPTTHIEDLDIDPQTPTTLYVWSAWWTQEHNGLYKSTDGGEHWSFVGTKSYGHTDSLTIDPVTPTTLYMGTNGGGVYKSVDGGENWSASNTGLRVLYINTLTIVPPVPGVDPVAPTALYAGTWGGVFKSTNGGESWSEVSSGLTNTYIQALAIAPPLPGVDPVTSTTLYAGTWDGVFKSTNSGESWRAVNTGLAGINVLSLAVDPLTPSIVYAGLEDNGVFRSTNGGESWRTVNTDLAHSSVQTLSIAPPLSGANLADPTALYAGTAGLGVFSINITPPGTFAKSSPTHTAAGVTTNPVLHWEASSGLDHYEYCVDTSDNNACDGDWISTGMDTNVALSGLSYDTTYFWQVEAVTSGAATAANGGTWWSFTTRLDPSGGFAKISPANAAVGVSILPTLRWGASSMATGYEYCYDTTPDDACSGTWVSTGTNTSVALSGLSKDTTYYWQVRALSPGGTIAANSGTWWSFTTIINPPGPFVKAGPANAAGGIMITPTLSWEASSGAAHYEYCYDTTPDDACGGTWTHAGVNTSVNLSGLNYGTTYFWQVRAVNAAETIAANEGAWWKFTTIIAPPGAFYKTSPSTDTEINPILQWSISSQAASYEYCVDTSDDNDCSGTWISTGTNTYATLSGLRYNTNYYWQVRAINAGGTLAADSGVWWNFSSTPRKITPVDSGTGISLQPTLRWLPDSSAISYEYCYDTTNDNACGTTWINTGTNPRVTLSGLSYNTTYYWQVRVIDANGTAEANRGSWWRFSTALRKLTPSNSANVSLFNLTLTWGTGNDAIRYEYCYDTTNDNACDTTWINTGTNTSVTLSGLSYNTNYYWQVRVIDATGTHEADGGVWWSFSSTLRKLSPADAGFAIPLNPILSWEIGSGATSYEYCYDTTNDNACNTTWINTGTNTSVTLSGLSYNTIYYWQVRVINAHGTTEADWGVWWRFRSTLQKISPTNLATGIPLNSTLHWGTGNGAIRYEYCYDTTNDNACDTTWINTGTNTSATLSGLNYNTTYYWQVRVIDAVGTAEADWGVWWSFSSALSKISPAISATGVPLNPTLTWEAHSSAIRYEYCYKTTSSNTCNVTWSNAGTNTSVTLSGLSYNTTYYWQVRIIAASGTTEANLGTWWKFTTMIAPPDPFTKVGPVNSATGISPWPTLSWGASSGATRYEYCYDSSDDNLCNGTWNNAGTSTSVLIDRGLGYATTYYWQVRAINASGTTAANGDTWWSFTTRIAPPGPFAKTSPANAATGVGINPTLSWNTSARATSYLYCVDTTFDDNCDGTWISSGTNTSVTLSGLSPNTNYYWQVLAVNVSGTTEADADYGIWSRFATGIDPPSPFTKFTPTNFAAGLAINPTLRWSASDGAAHYVYCYDTTNDNTCDGALFGAGTNTHVDLVGLSGNTTYYWQVWAVNARGTTPANSDIWWSFTTAIDLSAPFSKSGPANAATGVANNPTLSWQTSNGAISYEYCYDTTQDNACDNAWKSTGANTSTILSGLTTNTTYYWQVRAANANGTIDANDGTWWSFTTLISPPGSFSKFNPPNTAVEATIHPTLSWKASSWVTGYEYCYDTTPNNTCDGEWISTGTHTQVTLSGLSKNTTYEWQVRAINAYGTLSANDNVWWNFTISATPDRWTSMGLAESPIYTLAIDPKTPTTLYAGTFGGGVFKRTNGEKNWRAIHTGLTNLNIYTLVIDPVTPTTLYAGGSGVFKSTNGGDTWIAVTTGLPYDVIHTLVIDPATPTTLYVGTGGNNIFKSTNGGETWNPASTGMTTSTNVYTLVIDPVTPTTLYAGRADGVFKSTNGGETWSIINTGLTSTYINALVIDPTTPTTLYAGTSLGGVFKSINGGTTWNATNTGLSDSNIRALAIDPATPSTLYAGTYSGGVFKSTNSAEGWDTFNTGLPQTTVWALTIDPVATTVLYAGTGGKGVFSTWNFTTPPILYKGFLPLLTR